MESLPFWERKIKFYRTSGELFLLTLWRNIAAGLSMKGGTIMPWTRFPIWVRWGELTRFRAAAEAALASELERRTAIPLEAREPVVINNPGGRGTFECSSRQFNTALGNEHLRYSMLLGCYTGLIEEHGRNLIEEALIAKKVPRTAFPGLGRKNEEVIADDAEAAEDYILKVNVETWGQKFFDLGKKLSDDGKVTKFSWDHFGGGMAGVAEAFALRNITTHGLSSVSLRAFNRMKDAGCDPAKWPVGKTVTLNREQFNDCVQNLRAFARSLADCAVTI